MRVVLARLEAIAAHEVALEESARSDLAFYRARCGPRCAYVDRTLAVRLRALGAVWAGDVSRDPCAVA